MEVAFTLLSCELIIISLADKNKKKNEMEMLFIWMDNFLWLLMIIYLCWWLFAIICLSKEVFLFVKNIFIIISSMDKWASWLKMIKQKIQDFMIWKI